MSIHDLTKAEPGDGHKHPGADHDDPRDPENTNWAKVDVTQHPKKEARRKPPKRGRGVPKTHPVSGNPGTRKIRHSLADRLAQHEVNPCEDGTFKLPGSTNPRKH